ncbi:unnamed protein product [Trichobilharzia regenti]|nr:unnamed protein product [Trichobilharzia regenti]
MEHSLPFRLHDYQNLWLENLDDINSKLITVAETYLLYRVISLPDGTRAYIGFHSVVNAAGPWAGRVAELAEIGSEHLPIRLPVEPR